MPGMSKPSGYDFLDCGNGRRLERLGGVIVDRPAPAAAFPPGLPPERWREASLSFSRETGWLGTAPGDWQAAFEGVRLGLRPASQGQVGVFPEHVIVCDRLDAVLDADGANRDEVRILNLFAHTGLATLRLASRGNVAVAHIDAAPAAVRQAKENAALSGMEKAPVRWLVDDALTFMRREVRRGNRYHLILADPPSFGRSGKGGEWKLDRDLPALLEYASALLAPDAAGMCLTCHSEGWSGDKLAGLLRMAMPQLGRIEMGDLPLRSHEGGRTLRTGMAALARPF